MNMWWSAEGGMEIFDPFFSSPVPKKKKSTKNVLCVKDN